MTLVANREVTPQAALAARHNDPAVAGSLSSLLDHADLIALLVASLDGFIARSEVIGDSLVDGISELREVAVDAESKVDVKGLLDAGRSLASSLPKATPGIAAIDSGALLPRPDRR